MVPITVEQIARGWQEIRRQEEMHQRLLEVVELRPDVPQVQKQADTAATVNKSQSPVSSQNTQQKPRPSNTKKKKDNERWVKQPAQQSVSKNLPEPEQIRPPTLDLDDDEPDRL